jgi:anti-sigma regulatory factor (Ser/Thr protein kinase)
MSFLIQIQLNKLQDTLSNIEDYFSYLDAKLLYKVIFISEEILTNLKRHATFLKKDPDISLSIQTSNTIQLTFKDNAEAFNILEYPDADIDADIQNRKLGGLGIYLTKQYAKEIYYFYKDGYNILKIIL